MWLPAMAVMIVPIAGMHGRHSPAIWCFLVLALQTKLTASCSCGLQWQPKQTGAVSPSPWLPALPLPILATRLDALMKAMRNAPARGVPMPNRLARAGINFRDAKAKPVPRISAPFRLRREAVAAGVLFGIQKTSEKKW
jgi:hypothetical protein